MIKFTCSKVIVLSERPCHEEHPCFLTDGKTNGQSDYYRAPAKCAGPLRGRKKLSLFYSRDLC